MTFHRLLQTILFVLLLAAGVTSGGDAPAPSAERGAVPAAAAIPPLLTLGEALTLFRSQGLDLLLADAAVWSAEADKRIASGLYNPQVGLGRGQSRTYDPALCATPGCSDVSVQASVSEQGLVFDFLLGKRHLRIDVAKAALLAAKLSRADAERTLALGVKEQYLAMALAKGALAFALENDASAAETLRLVEIRYRAGAVSEADVARAESAKLEAEQGVDQAKQALRQAKVTLAFLLGVRGPAPEFQVADELLGERVPLALQAATAEELLQKAMEKRPDLKAADAQRARAVASLSLAKRQRIPDLPLSFSYSKEGVGQSAIQPPTTTFSLSVNVPLFYQQQGEIAKAEADLWSQKLQYAKAEAQVASDVQAGLAAFEGARARVERMEARLLGRTERARDLVKIQYEKGAASLLELLDAERALIATRVERLQDLNDYWTAVFQLEEATGMELREP